MESYVTNDNDFDSRENSPKNQDSTLDIPTIIGEVENLHKVVTIDLAKLNTTRALFNPFHKLDPTELAGGEATLTKILPDNGKTPPLLTQLSSQYSP